MSRSRSSSISSSELFEGLEDQLEQGEGKTDSSFNWGAFREARIQQLAEEVERSKTIANQGGTDGWYGFYREISEERELIQRSSKEEFCIIHFSHPDFQRCAIMDRHLQALASRHLNTLFLRASVENAPFLVHRLGVKVLPCVISFINGNAVDRLIGFEELGNDDNFTTAALEFRLKRSGVLPPPGYRKTTQAETLVVRPARASDGESDEEPGNGRRKIIRSNKDDMARARRGQRNDSGDDWD
ncbi:hypothetical protein NliqN6_1804 [Naganishia liquefaciens]|uniref:Thioredoxin family protein n=1 Tax=Naganishia liquefaciens TaxID=104408 RepID=A0A8H3TQL0_9TREE|nr:hypothetical protein NliqN6_1804 [Naganishia liquefaciens]